MDKNFIVTKDENTAKELECLGCELISQVEDTFYFVNCKKQSFAKVDTNKIFYTNILHI